VNAEHTNVHLEVSAQLLPSGKPALRTGPTEEEPDWNPWMVEQPVS